MTVRESVQKSLTLLSPSQRHKLALAVCVQMATSLLDLAGIILLGLVGTLAITTAQGLPPVPLVETIAGWLGLAALSSAELLAIFAAAAAVLFLVKSLASAFLLRRVFRFLAGCQAAVSVRLARALLARPLTFVHQRSSQETSYALVQGATSATLMILGQGVVLISESSLLLVLGAFLLFVSPVVAISSIAFFALVALLLQLLLGRWAQTAGQQYAESDLESLESIQEVMTAYREVTVTNRRGFYIHRLEALRWRAANAAADLQFISALPKYIFEIALVVGSISLAAILFATRDAVEAVGTLSLFLAAATRVMPSILRLQAATLSMRNAAGLASYTTNLAESLNHLVDSPDGSANEGHPGAQLPAARSRLRPDVILENVTFTYPGSERPAIRDASIRIRAGTSVALVGASGAGKSTLADLALGILEPQVGQALIGSVRPSTAIQQWPGAMAYVPQEIAIANSSVRLNVALGIPQEDIDDDLVWEALDRARLREKILADPNGLDALIGERGLKLSGGQRQRLGIARALYTRPKLLVLDEATSSLDAETERDITRTIQGLEGSVTTLIIAHRLSTVRHVDQVLYLDHGTILARGSFDEVRRAVPAFDQQAGIMGLV